MRPRESLSLLATCSGVFVLDARGFHLRDHQGEVTLSIRYDEQSVDGAEWMREDDGEFYDNYISIFVASVALSVGISRESTSNDDAR